MNLHDKRIVRACHHCAATGTLVSSIFKYSNPPILKKISHYTYAILRYDTSETGTWRTMMIYKICDATLWDAAVAAGRFKGAEIDLADGYIHFSTAEQMRETAAKHFAGREGLVIVAVDADALGEAIKWEPSRGGALFPHLYRDLLVEEAAWSEPLPLDAMGAHIFPERAV